MRNLTKTLAVVSLLASANAYPLGIGELKLHSALNQNLNADITLVLAAGEKVADIKVNLASPETFAAQGVPWSAFLSKIKFQPSVQANGTVVIKVSSNEALKEPYLDLLLEVQWPKGNLYREFTVLVDPPSVYKQASVPLAVSNETETALTTAKAVVTPPVVSPTKAPVLAETKLNVSKPVAPPTAEKLPPASVSSSQYGPTRPKETLWSIAEQTKDNDATVTQMAVAIFAQNPDAFRKGNINRLIPERTLQIPDKSVVLRLSPAQASADFRQYSKGRKNHPIAVAVEENTAPTPRQHTTLNAKHKQTANASEETVSVKPQAGASAEKPVAVENQLKLIAPSEAVVPDNAVVTSGKTSDAQAKGKSSKKSAKEPEMSVADRALQAKLAELEQQLNTMQKVLALKDQQLSALQNQARINETATPPATPAVVAAKPEVPPAIPAKPVVSAELKPTTATPPATPAVVATKPEVPPATPAKPVVSAELKPTTATPPATATPAVVAIKPEVTPATPAKPVVSAELKPTTATLPATPAVVAAKPEVTPATPAKPVVNAELKPTTATPPATPAVVAAKPEVTPATPAKPVVSAELKPTTATPPATPAVVAVKPEVTPATPAKPVVSAEATTPAVVAVKPEIAPVPAVVGIEPKPTAPPPTPAVAPVKPETAAVATEKKPTAVKKPAVKAPVATPVEENTDIESYLLAGAGGTVLLGLIGFFWWRKRKIDAELENDPYSAHQTEASKAAIKNKVSNKSSAVATNAAIPEDSIGFDTNNLTGLSDFAPSDFDIFNPSDFDTFDTNQDEIDPVSEADVYLAYGRYQQAEELMRDAIKEQPHRDECKLKLLEIFYSNENKQAFAEYARELAESGKAEDPVFWAKVMEMGSELCPNVDLFTEEGLSKIIKATPATSANKSSALNAENDLGLMSFDSSFEDLFGGEASAQTQDSQSSKISPTSFEDSFADFDFSSFDQENTEEEATVAAETGQETHAFEDSFADFDLSSFGDQEATHADETPESFTINDEPAAKAIDKVTEDVESVEFDFDGLLEQPSAKSAEVTKAAEEIESVEFDFDGLLEQPSAKPVEITKAAEEIESVEFDFDGLLEQPSAKPTEVPKAAEEIESVEFDFDGLLEQPSAKPAEVTKAAEEIESVEFDFDGLLEQPSTKPVEVKEAINEFDFSEFKTESAQAKVELTKETPVNEFDFSEFEQESVAETKAGKFDFDELLNPVEDDAVIDSHEEIDEFDFSAFENKTAKAEIIDTPINEFDFSEFENETAKAETVETPVNEFDFSEFADLKAEPPKNVEPTNKEKATTVDHDENDYASVDFDFDFDMPIGRKATNQKGSVEFAELTEMDEIEIKLDLARAYIDMDDTDSAKSIVREVLEKGTDEQKMVAQAIMDYLA